MTSPYKATGCYICLDCPNHLTNQKFDYVIPCKEKTSCNKYLSDIEEQKAAKRVEREEKASNYLLPPYKRKR